MKLFCCFTPAHRVLFDDWFRPSLPASFDLQATEFPLEGPGDFCSPEFLRCIRLKIAAVIASIEEHAGQLIVWSDIDIQFFADPVPELRALAESSPADLFFQREGPRVAEINAGFVLIRCTAEASAFFRRVLATLEIETAHNEQWIINQLLPATQRAFWDYLPRNYYARTHGWPPPRHLTLYHANFTPGAGGIGQKIRQFEEIAWVRRWGAPAWLWSCLRRAPGKILRLIAARGAP